MSPAIALFTFVQGMLTTAPAPEARASAASLLESGLAAARAQEPEVSDAQRAAKLREALAAAAKVLGEKSLVSAQLGSLAAGTTDFAELRRAALVTATDLGFTPAIEAERPRGFPGATPVGEIAVLDYPGCRLARVPMERDSSPTNSAFWKLFQHIQSNSIPMTAPVEMTYDPAGKRQTTMAFLYASTEVGKIGPAGGDVEVVDIAPVRVASFGLRGRRTEARVQDAKRAIDAWLARQEGLEAAGNLRVMGWNGPMTPTERCYFEVQLPVRAVEPASGSEPASGAR